MLDFRLQTFLDLCITKNFTKTANNLHITQPAVSQHIKFLEKYYKTKLFLHEGRSLLLTEQGKLLHEFVMTVNADSEAIRHRLESEMPEPDELHLGAITTAGEVIMPHVVSEYLKVHPKKRLTMYLSETEQLLNKLQEGKIDFAIVDDFFPKSDYESEFLTEDQVICVCSPQHPMADQTVDFKELYSERLIFRENNTSSLKNLQRILLNHNQDLSYFQSQIEIGSINAVKNLVMENAGISFIYRFVVGKELEKGRIAQIHIQNFSSSHYFNFVWMKNSFFSESNKKFLQICKKVLKESGIQ